VRYWYSNSVCLSHVVNAHDSVGTLAF